MARRHRRPDERDEDDRGERDEERPLDSGTVQALRAADPKARAQEPAPSGRMEKAALYREAIEAELDAAPLAAKSERDLMQDNVNTIGQIFTNYQAALHLFEDAVQDGAGEAVPRELAKEVLQEAARDVFHPVLAAAAETAGEVADHVADGIGVTDVHPAETPREPGASAPAFALRNLLVA